MFAIWHDIKVGEIYTDINLPVRRSETKDEESSSSRWASEV